MSTSTSERYIRPGEKLVDARKFRARNEAGMRSAKPGSLVWHSYKDNLKLLDAQK